MVDHRAILKEVGWRQFSIIELPDCKIFGIFRSSIYNKLLKHSHVKIYDSDLLLIITQTCDLVNDINKEPFFEVMPMHALDREPHINYKHGKDNRRIELNCSINGVEKSYYILPYERFVVSHDVLLDLSPCGIIDEPITKESLLNWLTARINRTAFPDKYDSRWKSNRKKIEKAIKKLERVKDIYISLSTFDELSDSDEYEVDILLLMSAEDFDDKDIHAEYEKLRKKLEDEFCKCNGLVINNIELISSADLTLEILSSGYHRWDYSYLSYRDPVKHEMPMSQE